MLVCKQAAPPPAQLSGTARATVAPSYHEYRSPSWTSTLIVWYGVPRIQNGQTRIDRARGRCRHSARYDEMGGRCLCFLRSDGFAT
jgi:hypothetical protein